MEILKMKDVSLLYDADKDEKTYAVRQANLSLEEGKFYGILGPSGSGKSSLLYLFTIWDVSPTPLIKVLSTQTPFIKGRKG